MIPQLFLLLSIAKCDPQTFTCSSPQATCPDANKDYKIEFTSSNINDGSYCSCSDVIAAVTFSTTGDDTVTDIPNQLFYDDDIEKLTISNKIETIGTAAFYKCRITTIEFQGTSLTDIGEYAFFGCEIGNALNLPTSLETIGQYAFSTSKFTDINLPQIKSISNNAFQGCNLLTGSSTQKLIVEESISEYAFDGCQNLNFQSIECKSISQYAFRDCYNLIAPTIHLTSLGSISQYAFQNCYRLASTLTIDPPKETDPPNIHSQIGSYAFQNTAIRYIDLPYMTSIGSFAFQNCLFLEGTTAENGKLEVETISNNAFEGDIKLRYSTITAENVQYSAFEGCRMLSANIVIVEGGTIGPNAFRYCDNLGKLTIDLHYLDDTALTSTGISISQYAFDRSGLQGPLVIPYTISNIQRNAFSHCPNINNLTFDSNEIIRQTINDEAFCHSNIGSTLVIPPAVHSIQQGAFLSSSIETLIIEGTNYLNSPGQPNQIDYLQISKDSFAHCPNLRTVVFNDGFISFKNDIFKGSPLQSIRLGKVDEIPEDAFIGMSTLTGTIEIPDTVTTIGARAFSECYNIQNISFSSNSQVTTINEAAFYRCTSLQSTSIPKGVTDISPYTYYQCQSLRSIELPNHLETIGEYAFYDCSSLNCPLNIQSELESIGSHAFQRCSLLNGNLQFPNTLTSIGEQAFKDCFSLTGSLTFSPYLTMIEKEAFRDCYGFNQNLVFLDYIDTVSQPTPPQVDLIIQDGAFQGCSNLTGDLKLPRRIQLKQSSSSNTLSNNVFKGCSSLNGEITIADSVSYIPDGTFSGCSQLTGEIPINKLNSINYIGRYAFYDCYSLTGPLDLRNLYGNSIGDYAFYNCRGLDGEFHIREKTSTPYYSIGEFAFYGCAGLKGTLDTSSFGNIKRSAFQGCSGFSGPLRFAAQTTSIGENAFADCTGFSDRLSFTISQLYIGNAAFKGCTGFKKGTLSFTIQSDEEATKLPSYSNYPPHYYYNYFLTIENEAFKDTKFDDIYYLGRYQPDCDYDIGFSHTKGIHTSSNYANKSFCSNPIHKNSLSGGAIAGIVIAVVVVVAAIVALIVFLILRNKKNKDNSEAEVEMNQDP